MPELYGDGDLKSLQTLLQGVNLLGQDLSHSGDSGKDDPGATVLESVATTATKRVGAAVAALGGVSVVLAAVGGFWGTNPETHVPLIYGASLVAAACVLALALVVVSDLRSRSFSQAATYAARGAVTVEFMKLRTPPTAQVEGVSGVTTPALSPLTPIQTALVALAATRQRNVQVTVSGATPGSGELVGIREQDGTVKLHVQSDDRSTDYWFSLGDVHLGQFPSPR